MALTGTKHAHRSALKDLAFLLASAAGVILFLFGAAVFLDTYKNAPWMVALLSPVHPARTVVGCVLIALGGFIIAGNWVVLVKRVRGQTSPSSIPLLGAVLVGIGLRNISALSPYFWVAILIDPATILMVLGLFQALLRHRQVGEQPRPHS